MPRRFSHAGVGQLKSSFCQYCFRLPSSSVRSLCLFSTQIFNFSVFPPYAMWLNVISINLMQLSKRMLFTEWKNVWFTRYKLCTGDKVRHTGRPSTIQSVRVCQTRMATTCGGSSPTTLFQPPIWVIGRARLSSVGAPSNQPYRLDWLEELHTGHPGIVRIVHCY